MDDIIARIKQKLAYLQTYDDGDTTDATYERKSSVERHYPYEIDTTYTEDEIAEYETRHHIRLPEDYRQFLMEIGSRGYNPSYVMYSPLEDVLTLEEERDFIERFNNFDEEMDEDELWKEDAPIVGVLSHPFPFKTTMTYKAIERFSAEHGLSFDTWLLDGYLPIGFSGCTCWYILIVSGEARGQIWYQDGLSLFAPVFYVEGNLYHHSLSFEEETRDLPDTQRVTFTQWYEAWLNKHISLAQEHWRKRGRTVPPLNVSQAE